MLNLKKDSFKIHKCQIGIKVNFFLDPCQKFGMSFGPAKERIGCKNPHGHVYNLLFIQNVSWWSLNLDYVNALLE